MLRWEEQDLFCQELYTQRYNQEVSIYDIQSVANELTVFAMDCYLLNVE